MLTPLVCTHDLPPTATAVGDHFPVGRTATITLERHVQLLVVAGMDRLDTELTAAHMQGRFQLKLVYGCGHSVQEDQPGETANSILSFAFRWVCFFFFVTFCKEETFSTREPL